MGKPQAPKPPSPVATSAAQTGTNIGTAIANASLQNVNQVGPNGSLTYSQSGSTTYTDPYTKKTYQIPNYTATTSLTPTGQAINDQNQGAQLNLATLANQQAGFLKDYMPQGIDTSGLPELQGSYGPEDGYAAERSRVEAAMMERMRPELERARAAADQRLANQGLAVGSRAYSAAQDDLARGETDARLGVILAGGQEQSRLAGLDAQRAGFINGARSQGMSEAFARRNQPINEIAALLSGSQVQMPNFQVNRPGAIPTTDVAGNIWNNYQARNAQYQTQLAGWNNAVGAIGGTLFGMM